MVLYLLLSILLLIVLLNYLPIKGCVLLEGIFDHQERMKDLYGKKWTIFIFENYCRECIETGYWQSKDRHFAAECKHVVPANALKIGGFKESDSIKIVGLKNVFGKVVAAIIIKSRFAEEFAAMLASSQRIYSEKQRKRMHKCWEVQVREMGLSV